MFNFNIFGTARIKGEKKVSSILGENTEEQNWHKKTSEEALQILRSSLNGLSTDEVQQRLLTFGRNQLPETKKRSHLNIFFSQFLSPLIYLLLFASIIAFFIGEAKDSLVILIVVFLNAVIGTLQEGRAEQSLDALRKLSQLQSRVVRNDREQLVEASEVVPGDILSLAAGDAIPADSRIIDSSQLTTAEAALTGESLPVEKNSQLLTADTLLADRINMIYAGTYVHSGRCRAIVTATGLNNEIGKIAQLASTTVQPKTKLELRIHHFGRLLIIASILISAVVVIIGIFRNIPLAEIFMVAISQMVSLVPEGLPVAMTIALAVGVQRMAKRGTIVRRLSAVETLGSTTIICTDKTGTLTRNEMTVTNIYLPYQQRSLTVSGIGYSPNGNFIEKNNIPDTQKDDQLIRLLRACVLCNDAQLQPPQQENENWKVLGDPTEGALLTLALKGGIDALGTRNEFPRAAEIPFDSENKMMATQNRFDEEYYVFLKGAPESLLDLCFAIDQNGETKILSSEIRSEIQSAAHTMADSALRVLAFAYIKNSTIDLSAGFKSLKNKGVFLGLVGQIDPPRSEIAQAITDSGRAGIRTVMVTGDHKATGKAIATNLGISRDGDIVIDGKELETLSDGELDAIINKVSVFARVHPAQKLRIVETFQRMGHVVAMTGDGVNDAPALVKADVGVAMGITGTEVAKEASKIVITDDNFATIVAAVAEGRLVYQNIKKLILFLFVTSIDEVLILLLALLFGYPIPLAAVQILWINLVTEGTLTINLIMEPFEGDEMQRLPTPTQELLLDRSLLSRIPLMVAASVTSTFGWFIFRASQGVAPDLVKTETFTVLAVCQWFNVLNCRSSIQTAFSLDLIKNPWLIGGLVLGNILHLAVIYWKPLSQFFHTVPIAPTQFISIGAVASLVLWVEELRKYYSRRKQSSNCVASLGAM
ncbi:MAG: hypothetical protein RJB66_1102 [Pseudomonadota bacterium]|jgi:Ca2+-transporting ATPase